VRTPHARLTRLRTLERPLRAGARVTVAVTRRGYVGRRTTIVVRQGTPPTRHDTCLSTSGRAIACPTT
jgi:hypothetical protein